MSIVKSGTNARLRFNHRGGADADRQLLGVVIEKRIPAGAGVHVSVDQPTVLPQSDDAQRNGTVSPAQPFVIERAVRPLVTSRIGGVQFRSEVRTLSTGGGSGSGGPLLPAQVEPSWVAVGVSLLTVIAFGSGAGDTVVVTPLGGAALTLTEGVDFTAVTDNATTAENIRVALLVIGVVAIRVGAVLLISTPLSALVSGDLTAWTTGLTSPFTPPPPAGGLIPKGRYDSFVGDWPFDPNGTVPNAGHRPAGQYLRVRWLGTPVLAEGIGASGATAYAATLANRDTAPGSVVITAEVGSNALILRDNGAGRLVGQESVGGASGDGTIDYRTGDIAITFSAVTTGAALIADYEHSCLYLPLDINLEWDAELAQG